LSNEVLRTRWCARLGLRFHQGQADGHRPHSAFRHFTQCALYRPSNCWTVLAPSWRDASGVADVSVGRGRMGCPTLADQSGAARMSATQIATLHTSAGDIRVELFGNHAPKTVRNFVNLATGGAEWTHPGTGQKTN